MLLLFINLLIGHNKIGTQENPTAKTITKTSNALQRDPTENLTTDTTFGKIYTNFRLHVNSPAPSKIPRLPPRKTHLIFLLWGSSFFHLTRIHCWKDIVVSVSLFSLEVNWREVTDTTSPCFLEDSRSNNLIG